MHVRAFWGFFENCFNISFNEKKGFSGIYLDQEDTFPKLLGHPYAEKQESHFNLVFVSN